MKKIEVYLQQFMLQKVTEALNEIDIRAISGLSVWEIKGFGKEKDESYPHHSRDYVSEFTPKVKIEIICPDKDVDKIIEVIKNNAHTGRRGDGKIFVYDSIERAISIRTYEEGDNAI